MSYCSYTVDRHPAAYSSISFKICMYTATSLVCTKVQSLTFITTFRLLKPCVHAIHNLCPYVRPIVLLNYTILIQTVSLYG